MSNAKDLANLVLQWEKVDDEVAKEGWGGNRDERWDALRTGMIAAANEVLFGGTRGECRDIVIKSVVKDEKASGIRISVRPASLEKEGFVSIRLVASEGNDDSSCLFLPVCLGFSDLCAVLSVLCGIEESVSIEHVAPVAPVSMRLEIVHSIEGVYMITVSVKSEEKSDTSSVFVGSRDALGLKTVIEHAMLLVGFGSTDELRRA